MIRGSGYIRSRLQRLKENLKNNISRFRRPPKLHDKIFTIIARAEKAWLLYEFPYNLNPSDMPNDAQTSKSDSPLHPVINEDQFQAYSKKNLMGH